MQRQTTDLIKIQPKHWYLRTYCKPNDEILYIHAKSYHPENTFKQLTTSVEVRIFNLSSKRDIFIEASKHYQNILNQFGSDYKPQYKPPNNENESKSKSSKNRKRNIQFNPSFSKNISNSIDKYFLLLIQKHFPNHKYHKLLSKNNVKISYSCIANIKSMINIHNKE